MRVDNRPRAASARCDPDGESEAAVLVLADYTLGDALLTVLWIFMFVIFFWLLIAVFSDIFRSHDLSGWGKALWSIFIVIFPYLGIFVYLIVRGGKMHERALQQQQAANAAFTSYVQQAAGTSASTADELQKLAALRDQGVITVAEFEAQKAKVLA
jgi:hypothetical protein